MKILLTGATGFLGNNLLKKLTEIENITIILLLRKTSNLDKIKKFNFKINKVYYNEEGIEKIFFENNIDVIIHTATTYGRFEDKESVFKSNLILPLKLICSANKQVKKTIFINTDTFYGTNGYYNNFLNNYISTKKMLKNLIMPFGNFPNVIFINLILEHLYGPNDRPEKFIPTIFKNCINNKKEILLTKGEQLRNFIYVDDVVKAYEYIITHLNSYEFTKYNEYSIGCNQLYSIRTTVELIHRITNSSSKLNFGAVQTQEGEIFTKSNPVNSLAHFGWRCDYSLEKGLKKILSEQYGG
ncbi:NAD-dependent epimerase/dehydratase family protein [Bacillus velezensis]|uniref:NAD-dependent epimerase/dehydratase family protein n=1 Tax=Bacillus velezensis TaxID=492670 RepID=UPI0039AF5146